MAAIASINRHPELQPYIAGADHRDVKSITCAVDLRTFIAGMLAYHPWWLKMLFGLRQALVLLLGLGRHPLPASTTNRLPEEVPFAPGDRIAFFTVRAAAPGHYWVAETPEDKHLRAFFGVVAEPKGNRRQRFHVFTAVRYRHWTGPVYFNLIRPFHHLVVWRMMKAGAASKPRQASAMTVRR
jgi:hypothetical protein